MTGTETRKSKRGLASASRETVQRVAKSGGEAFHTKRGLQALDQETRRRIATLGGLARAAQRKRESAKR